MPSTYTAITKPSVGDPTRKDTFADIVVDNLDFLNGKLNLATTQAGIVNGSFEIGTGANTAPSGWALTVAAGNSSAFAATAANTRHGAQAFQMTTPGAVTGGVILSSTDFIACAEAAPVSISWRQKSTAAAIRNMLQIKWYDISQALISTSTLLDSTANPTSWTFQSGGDVAPANARFFKVFITGVNNTTAGTVYWDDFELTTELSTTSQIFTSSGSFVAPAGVNLVKVRMWSGGGGGGSGADNAANGGNGGPGGDSYFGAAGNKARGGLGGGGGVIGGTTTGAIAADLTAAFSSNYIQFGTHNSINTPSAHNGAQATLNLPMFGYLASGVGGITGGSPAPGQAGADNTGQGGGGGAGNAVNGGGGAPGGYGEYAEWWITVVPETSYTVNVGAAGAAGTPPSGGAAGGVGGKGLVIVEWTGPALI